MATQNSINTQLTINADGFSQGGGTTLRTLTITGANAIISAVAIQLASNTFTFPAATDTLVGRASTDTLTNKTINATNNTLSNIDTTMFAANIIDNDSTLAANSATRLATQQAVKAFVNNLINGVDFKEARVASVANVTVSNPATAIFDGVTLSNGDIILLRSQTTAPENGLYTFNGSGSALTRITGFQTAAQIAGSVIVVQEGSTLADTSFLCTTDVGSFVLATTAINFTYYGKYTAGTGITLTGNSIALANTAVSPASYTSANITVDQQGRITSASNGSGGGSGITWTEVTTTSQTAAINSGYIANNASQVVVTLPTTAVQGSIIRIAGKGAGGWKVAQNAGQVIYFGNSTTTSGATGSLAATQQRDTVELLCITANTEFQVLASHGNITYV